MGVLLEQRDESARVGYHAGLMAQPCRVKICGVRTPEAIHAAAEAGADAVGFVFAERSARFVSPESAAALAATVPPFVELVGLFTETPVRDIPAIADAVPLHTLQLHDKYDADAIASLAPRRVVRSVSFDIDTAEDQLRRWEQHYRDLPNLVGLIVDTPDPTQIGGGTGRTFDWNALAALLDALRPTAPIILAGGLTAENVGRAVETLQPWAVDVSSGVESERAVKDPARIRAFCQAVR